MIVRAVASPFVSNHDKNAWEGTEFEAYGPGLESAMVLSVVGEGIPLIYNGQEAGSDQRLAFFERDPIAWKEHPNGDLYRRLFALKKANPVLWNAQWGAPMIDVPNDRQEAVLSFVRHRDGNKVFAAFNFSASPVRVSLKDTLYVGHYRDFTSGAPVQLATGATLELPAWGYRVLVQ